MFDGIKLTDEHLVFITAEAGAEEGSKRLTIQPYQFLLNRLQPNDCRAREIEDGHGNSVGIVDHEHLEVLLAERLPELRIFAREHREIHGWGWLAKEARTRDDRG